MYVAHIAIASDLLVQVSDSTTPCVCVCVICIICHVHLYRCLSVPVYSCVRACVCMYLGIVQWRNDAMVVTTDVPNNQQHGHMRAFMSTQWSKDNREKRRITCSCNFDKAFEVRCSFGQNTVRGNAVTSERKPLTLRLFEADETIPPGLAGRNRPNLGTLVLDLVDFASLQGARRKLYSVSVPKSVRGAIGKAYIEISVCVGDSRNAFQNISVERLICEQPDDSDDDSFFKDMVRACYHSLRHPLCRKH